MSTDLQDIGRLIKSLQNRHHRMVDAALAEIGSTLSQWDALRAIKRHPDASSHVLAEYTFQTDQSFGALAMKLEEKGLIARTPGRGRALQHSLTPTGNDILTRATKIAERVLAQSFAPLSKAEQAQLLSLITTVLGTEK
jgi:DNA-binding MarR family transcriptional regulator